MNILILCERAAIALFDSIWHAALLLAIVAIALRLLPRLTAAARSLLWTAALILVAALPFLPIQASQTLTQTLDHTNPIHLNPLWSLAVAAIWAAFTLFRAVQLLASAIRLRHIHSAATPLDQTSTVKLPLGLSRTATLCLSTEVARPSVLGFFSPRILVPVTLYAKLSPAEIDHIVLHEMEHLRRLDDWRNLLQKVAVMLFPLNPALLWIERRLCFERELACDESVLAHTHAPRSYAACLVHLAEERTRSRQLSLALGAWERRSELGRRIHDILSNRTPASTRIRTACASVVTAAMLASALLLAKSPQLLTFTPAPVIASEVETPQPFSRAPQAHMIDTTFHIPTAAPAPSKPKHTHFQSLSKSPNPRLTGLAWDFSPTTNPNAKNGASAPDRRSFHDAEPRIVLTTWTYNQTYADATQTIRVQRVTYAIFQISSSETAPNPGDLLILQL